MQRVLNFAIVGGELRDREYVVEGRAVDGEQRDGVVWCEGAERLRREEALPLHRSRVPFGDRGSLAVVKTLGVDVEVMLSPSADPGGRGHVRVRELAPVATAVRAGNVRQAGRAFVPNDS